MNGVPLISKNLSGVSNVNVSGDVTAQTIQSSLSIYLNGLRSNVQTQIDTVALSKQGIQGNVGIQGNIGIQGIQGIQENIGIQGIQGVQGSTGSQGSAGSQGSTGPQGPSQSGGDILTLLTQTASIVKSLMTALSIIALQGQVAALELAVAVIDTSLAAIDVEIGTLQSQTFFLSSKSTPFGVPTEVNTGGPRTRIRSSLTVYDLSQNALTNIDWLNSTVSIGGAFNISYSNKLVLTADTGAVNAYVPLNVNGVFTQNGSSATLVNIPSTGNTNCYSGLSITNGNSNKIIQSYKCNTSNLNANMIHKSSPLGINRLHQVVTIWVPYISILTIHSYAPMLMQTRQNM